MKHIIRKMTKEDCKDVAHVITIAWNETYKEIVPDDFLKTEMIGRIPVSKDNFHEQKESMIRVLEKIKA